MAFQCLDKLTVGSTTYNLAQVTDFSVIPSSLESASPCSMVGDLRQSNAGVLPACLSTFGDLFMDCTSGTGDTMVVKDDEYFGIKIGRVHHGDYYSDSPNATGWVTQDKVANRLINNMGWGSMSGNAFRLYFAVVYDTSTERAYFIGIRDQYQHWGGNTGCFFHIFGGLSNGVDILYQSFIASLIVSITSNGGGATHIAKITGQLKDLSSNLSDILMVSGGGGGGLLVGDTDYSGKEAGGISGSGDNSADQTTGNAFGLGESGTNVSGGGSGLYGGYKGTSSKSGGAGSGYIGNSLLSNKKMVGYNVPTSSAEGTKTESVNEVSASPVGGKPKSGNGFARIKFLREPEYDTWIDGKRIYVQELDYTSQTLNQAVVESIIDFDIDTLISLEGTYDRINTTYGHYWYKFATYENEGYRGFARIEYENGNYTNLVYRINLDRNAGNSTSKQIFRIIHTKKTEV